MEPLRKKDLADGVLSVNLAAAPPGRLRKEQLALKSRFQRLAHAHYNPQRHDVQFAHSLATYRDLEAQYRAAAGDEHRALRTGLRAVMREERVILQGLEDKRERALQKILMSFDPAESERLFEDPLFCDALYVKADPEALIDALLSIQSNRSGGSDSLHEEAADLVKFTEVSSGCGLHEFYARSLPASGPCCSTRASCALSIQMTKSS